MNPNIDDEMVIYCDCPGDLRVFAPLPESELFGFWHVTNDGRKPQEAVSLTPESLIAFAVSVLISEEAKRRAEHQSLFMMRGSEELASMLHYFFEAFGDEAKLVKAIEEAPVTLPNLQQKMALMFRRIYGQRPDMQDRQVFKRLLSGERTEPFVIADIEISCDPEAKLFRLGYVNAKQHVGPFCMTFELACEISARVLGDEMTEDEYGEFSFPDIPWISLEEWSGYGVRPPLEAALVRSLHGKAAERFSVKSPLDAIIAQTAKVRPELFGVVIAAASTELKRCLVDGDELPTEGAALLQAIESVLSCGDSLVTDLAIGEARRSAEDLENEILRLTGEMRQVESRQLQIGLAREVNESEVRALKLDLEGRQIALRQRAEELTRIKGFIVELEGQLDVIKQRVLSREELLSTRRSRIEDVSARLRRGWSPF